MGFVKVGKVADVPPGTAKVYEAGDRSVAVCNVEGALYAVDDVCTHDEGSLDQGELDGFEIECPRHGARFDVRTGEVMSFSSATGALFPVAFGRDFQLDQLPIPVNAKLFRRPAKFEVVDKDTAVVLLTELDAGAGRQPGDALLSGGAERQQEAGIDRIAVEVLAHQPDPERGTVWRDLGHLEDYVPGVMDYLRTCLDQFDQ